jgi:hypothetical protein
VTCIDPSVYTLTAFDVLFLGGEGLQFGFQSQEDGLRKAVRQMKSHMLGHVGTFKVREVSAAVPLGSAILRDGGLHNANREIGVPSDLPRGGLRAVH